MNLLLKIATLIDALNRRIGQFMFLLLLLMILVGVYNATVSYFGGFLGAKLALTPTSNCNGICSAPSSCFTQHRLQKNGHVRVDVLQSRLSPKAKA